MLNLSYQPQINLYQQKIENYYKESKKPISKQNITFNSTNIAVLESELARYKKLEKKRLQTLALIKASQKQFKLLSQETNKKQNSLKDKTEDLNKFIKEYKNMAPTMIKGNSGKALEGSIEVVRKNTNTIQDLSSNLK
ncbi:hypothetical protein JNUCC83_12430 (plasmid) [Vagococcus sp. JNUCC 83]